MTDFEFWSVFTRPIVLMLLFFGGLISWYFQKNRELALEKQKLDYQKVIEKSKQDYQKQLDKEKMDYQKGLEVSHQALERELAKEQLEFDNKHNALKAVWSLLRYFSKIPSEDSVMYTVGKAYYFRKSQAKPFIAAVEKVFFIEGHGLYLPKEVKQPLFKIRDAIDRLDWENRENSTEKDFIIDAEVGKAIYQNRGILNKQLQASV